MIGQKWIWVGPSLLDRPYLAARVEHSLLNFLSFFCKKLILPIHNNVSCNTTNPKPYAPQIS